MATTTSTASTEKKPSAINLLSDSRDIYGSLLMLFQHNHDLCTSSGFFPDSVTMEVDSCAIGFRNLGLQTIDVASVISRSWLRGAILLYQNMESFGQELAVQELRRLAAEATKLSKIFKVIAAWARNIAGRVHTACSHVRTQISAFQVKFDQALEDSQLVLDQAKDRLTRAQEDLDDKEAEEERWLISLGATAVGYLIFFPLGALGSIITGTGYGIARKAVHDARDAKIDAEKSRNEAQRKFDAAKSTDEKAKMIAGVAADLLKSLNGMEIIANAIGQFWTGESAFFVGQVSDILSNQVYYSTVVLAHAVSGEQVKAWTGAQKMFDDYAAVMSQIMNFYNFSTTAQPAPTTTYHVGELHFDLKFPTDLHADKIMDGSAETNN